MSTADRERIMKEEISRFVDNSGDKVAYPHVLEESLKEFQEQERRKLEEEEKWKMSWLTDEERQKKIDLSESQIRDKEELLPDTVKYGVEATAEIVTRSVQYEEKAKRFIKLFDSGQSQAKYHPTFLDLPDKLVKSKEDEIIDAKCEREWRIEQREKAIAEGREPPPMLPEDEIIVGSRESKSSANHALYIAEQKRRNENFFRERYWDRKSPTSNQDAVDVNWVEAQVKWSAKTGSFPTYEESGNAQMEASEDLQRLVTYVEPVPLGAEEVKPVDPIKRPSTWGQPFTPPSMEPDAELDEREYDDLKYSKAQRALADESIIKFYRMNERTVVPEDMPITEENMRAHTEPAQYEKMMNDAEASEEETARSIDEAIKSGKPSEVKSKSPPPTEDEKPQPIPDLEEGEHEEHSIEFMSPDEIRERRRLVRKDDDDQLTFPFMKRKHTVSRTKQMIIDEIDMLKLESDILRLGGKFDIQERYVKYKDMQLQSLAKHMEQKRDYETPKYASNPYVTKWIELNTNSVGQALHKVTARSSELESTHAKSSALDPKDWRNSSESDKIAISLRGGRYHIPYRTLPWRRMDNDEAIRRGTSRRGYQQVAIYSTFLIIVFSLVGIYIHRKYERWGVRRERNSQEITITTQAIWQWIIRDSVESNYEIAKALGFGNRMDIFSAKKITSTTMMKYWNIDHITYIAEIPGINGNKAHITMEIIYEGNYKWRVFEAWANINDSRSKKIMSDLPSPEKCTIYFPEAAQTLQFYKGGVIGSEGTDFDLKYKLTQENVNWEKAIV